MTHEFAGPFAVVLGVILSRHVVNLMGKEPAFEMCPGLLEIRCYAAYGIPAFAYARIADRVTWTERSFQSQTLSDARRFMRSRRRRRCVSRPECVYLHRGQCLISSEAALLGQTCGSSCLSEIDLRLVLEQS